MEKQYIPRLIEPVIKEYLDHFGALYIEGCKWCGKSTTAERFARSEIKLQDPDSRDTNLEIAANQPSLLLRGEKPRLIDEWQDAPTLWDSVRHDVDETGLVGQYILTGSSVPKKKKPKHSGAGRIASITMRPMSLFESGDSNGEVSLADLFAGAKKIAGEADCDFEKLAYLCARGGWPENVIRKPRNANLMARDYLKAVFDNRSENDADFSVDSDRMRVILRSLARNVAMPIKLTTVLEDINENFGIKMSDVTLANYVDALERVHVLDDIEAWSPRLRSRTQMRTSAKRNFVDPSLVMASLRASEEDLFNDIRTYGLVFESLALRDLQVYAQSLRGELFYYRDKNGMECDAVVHLFDGRWGAVEIKLGANSEMLDAAAKNLLKFAESVDTEKMKKPAFLMVLSGIANYAYIRKDGVAVVPIGCLRP